MIPNFTSCALVCMERSIFIHPIAAFKAACLMLACLGACAAATISSVQLTEVVTWSPGPNNVIRYDSGILNQVTTLGHAALGSGLGSSVQATGSIDGSQIHSLVLASTTSYVNPLGGANVGQADFSVHWIDAITVGGLP